MENKLRQLRLEKNWTVKQLSLKSGVPRSTVAAIETDYIRNPSVWEALRLAKALGVVVEEIFIL